MLNSFSIDNLSIEIYENQIFNSDFTPIRVYFDELLEISKLKISGVNDL